MPDEATWRPTMRLRWLMPSNKLQQLWHRPNAVEWRDVPKETEGQVTKEAERA